MTVSQEPAVVGAAGRAGPARDEVRLRIGYCAVRTVLIDGRNTKSCQTPAERAVGTAVTTVEDASATIGPRFSMTRARSRHPGSPDSHPFARAAAPGPLQRQGWVAAFADDGTVTHESILVTWHGP